MAIFKALKVNSKIKSLELNETIFLEIEECYKKGMRMAAVSALRADIKISSEMLKCIDKNDNVITMLKITRIE